MAQLSHASAITQQSAAQQQGIPASWSKDLFVVADGKNKTLLRESYGFYGQSGKDLYMWREEVQYAIAKGLISSIIEHDEAQNSEEVQVG